MRSWRLPEVVVAAAACLAIVAAVQPKSSDAADDAPGIAVGEKAPDFKLPDQSGRERSLKELWGEGDRVLALVFYRSADW